MAYVKFDANGMGLVPTKTGHTAKYIYFVQHGTMHVISHNSRRCAGVIRGFRPISE